MKLAILEQRHPSYDDKLWRRYHALYAGGKAFRDIIHEFLLQNDVEPGTTYERRKKEACYRSYVGPIADFYAAALFGSPLVMRPKDNAGEVVQADDFYGELKEDCCGDGTDLVDFLRHRFISSLIRGLSWWLVDLPSDDGVPPASRVEWEDRGLGRAYLSPLDSEQVLDWECDVRGRLLWATVHSIRSLRDDPRGSRTMLRATWNIYDRTSVETFSIDFDPAKQVLSPEMDIPSFGVQAHGFREVPLVRMQCPRGMWLVDRVADAQTEHFRLSSALGWSMRRTCYAQPVFKIKDRLSPPVMGPGYGIFLDVDESVEWAAPSAEPFETIMRAIAAQKDEIYRVTHQMAAGVDNNAAAVGRSGESKSADAAATEVCLDAYASMVRESVEKTYQLLSDGRGEDYSWSVEGLDSYDLEAAVDTVTVATQVQLLGVPSQTFKAELMAHVAERVLPRLDQQTKDKIREEIEQGVESEAEMAELMSENHDGAEAMGSAGQGGPPGAAPRRGANASRPAANGAPRN